MKPPSYYARVESKARERWDQLERDPELAGPWHQLFRQVQSPRHVVSELLQNADDAHATMASVCIEDNTFLFEHDGHDFDEEQFASLCRFGFSNKRNLHTIGFRGVGFKSTFSIGDKVEVHTPTLTVYFKKERFTQPNWLPDTTPVQNTVIRVRITERNRLSELRKNFEEWTQSPTSLLFFNNLKELFIESTTIRKRVLKKGPVSDSVWVELVGADTQRLLVLSSEPGPLPNEAIDEIRAERGVVADDLHIPPCHVEIVLGLSQAQRLYVVLPTGAKVSLPFSCNAPFIQDPARFAVKDPAISPTNHWLLERTGRLVGQAMLQWLGNDALPLKDRANVYDLLNEAVGFEPGLEGSCSRIIIETMLAELNDKRVIITAEGNLTQQGTCVAVPSELYSVWQPDQLMKLFGSDSTSLLAAEVSSHARIALHSHNWIKVIGSHEALQKLEQCNSVPRPDTWPKLHALWSFVQNEIRNDWGNERRRRMKIVPVEKNDILQAANEVIRLSSKRDMVSPADWDFILDNVSTVDGEWLAWISQRAPKKSATTPNERVDPAHNLLQVLTLHEPSSVDRVVAQASFKIIGGKNVPLVNCVRIAHIMATLGAAVPNGFCYVTKDLRLRAPESSTVVDDIGRVQDLVPASWSQEHILHDDYSRNFDSCKPDVWRNWVITSKSGLLTFVPIIELKKALYSRSSVKQLVTSRGAQQPKEFYYRRDDFTVIDYGFPPELMKHWEKIARNDPNIWAGVLEGILAGPKHQWEKKIEAEIRHNGTTYYKNLDCGFIASEWITHFRGIACLSDTHGRLHTPAELLLRTPDTEPLMGVEPFVRAELDNEATKPLLRLLGVRDTPTGADKLLRRLHALSAIAEINNLLPEISRLYEALDRIVVRCTSTELKTIAAAFNQKALVLSDTGEWMSSNEISIFPDEENNSSTIHASLRALGLWPRIGVSERPALERTIEWLKTLDSGTKLDAASARRVRLALQRAPARIWNECRHWLSLNSTWEHVTTLKYRLSMQTLTKWGDLFDHIKAKTANLQMLSEDIANLPAFTAIPNLGDVVESRVTRLVESSSKTQQKGWLATLAEALTRVRFPSDEDTRSVRNVAQRLRQTEWRNFSQLHVTPYVEGVPAGEPYTPKALWQNNNLYVAAHPPARLYEELAEALARPFSHPQVSDAITACIERTVEFVTEYLDAHFEFDMDTELEVTQPGEAPSPSEPLLTGNPDVEERTPDNSGEFSEPDDQKTADKPLEKQEGGEPTEPPRQPKPTLIEMYTRQQGFRWSPVEKYFIHADGRRIQKSESPFNWEERASDGDLINRFWVTEQKLSNGVEIAAELWTLFGLEPSSSVLVVWGDDHDPRALAGTEIMQLKNIRRIMLHPARYRLVEQSQETISRQ